jgi:hypothetical protein
MVSLVDVESGGNSKRALDDLNAERAAAAAEPKEAKPSALQPANRPADNEPKEDPRFAGKSREEVLRMYENLEQHQGRLANELGQQRRTLDELLLQKRTQDLSANGATVPDVNPADLLARPKEVLDQYVTARAREMVEPMAQRLNQLEAALSSTVYQSRHSDSTEVTSSPEFKAWVNATPLRRQLAQNAAQGNAQAADALLTEFKATLPTPKGKNLEAALEKAGKVALEGNQPSDPAAKPTGKTYRRADLIALRARDPDAYNRASDEIYRAYREGRVVG